MRRPEAIALSFCARADATRIQRSSDERDASLSCPRCRWCRTEGFCGQRAYACVTSVNVKSPPLIVDEFGIWSCGRESATAFFSLVPARYERGCIILTSDEGFAAWGELLGDTVIATVILDGLLHHGHVINIRGESYRLKDKRQSGLLTSSQLLTPTATETQMER